MPTSKFTCDDFRRWTLEMDAKKRQPHSRSLTRHEQKCLPCVRWMHDRVMLAFTQHESKEFIQSEEDLDLISHVITMLDRRIAQLSDLAAMERND